MKNTVLYLALFIVLLAPAPIAIAGTGEWTKETTIKESGETAEDLSSICPTTLMKTDCLSCHVRPDWKLKEAHPNRIYDLPAGTNLVGGKLYFYLTRIQDYRVRALYEWLQWHQDIKHVVIEVQSPGGSVFAAKRIVGIMNQMKKEGYIVETHVNGFAASAGFVIFVAGSKGYRLVSPEAELMWHELRTFKFFDVSGPADKEDEADVLRHLQDTQNEWLASRSNMTKEEIDSAIRKKELWLNGAQAVEKGFADGFLGENK